MVPVPTVPMLLWENLQSCRDFLMVARTASFAAAARQTNRAASVVMRSVQRLEEALGRKLLERTYSGILLNETGQLVAARVQRMSDEIDAAAALYCADRKAPSLNALGYGLAGGRKLQIVLALSESGSVKLCAERLGMSQSGVSMSISRIEKMAGEALFLRRKKGFVATERTEQLLGHINRIAAEMRMMTDELDSVANGIGGTVVLGLLAVARIHLIPSALIDVRRLHPRVRIRTVQAAYDHMLEQLKQGTIDLVIGVASPAAADAGLRAEIITHDELGIFVRAGHPLSSRRTLALADLGREEWILPRRYSPSWNLIEDSFRAAGLAVPEACVETTDTELTRHLVMGSDLLVIASPRQFTFELQSGAVRRLPVVLQDTRRDIALIQRAGSLPSPAAVLLMEATRRRATQAVPGFDATGDGRAIASTAQGSDRVG